MWPESIDSVRHSRVSKAILETSSRPAPGAEVNQRDPRPLTSAHASPTFGSTLAVSSRAATSSEKHVHRVYAQHPTPSHPSPRSARPCSRPPWPEAAPPPDARSAQRSAAASIHPAAHAAASATHPRAPRGAPPAYASLTANRHCQETFTAPGPGGLSRVRGEGGVIAAVLAIRCAHLSQTRPGTFLLLENVKSRKGRLMCSHVWKVSGKVSVVVVSIEEQNQRGHNRRATYGQGPWVSDLS